MALSHDELWPRAGSWPAFEAGDDADAVLLGVPTWRSSLSPTGAHATPAAIREALTRYSATLMGPPVVDLAETLRILDAGDVIEPDGERASRRPSIGCEGSPTPPVSSSPWEATMR